MKEQEEFFVYKRAFSNFARMCSENRKEGKGCGECPLFPLVEKLQCSSCHEIMLTNPSLIAIVVWGWIERQRMQKMTEEEVWEDLKETAKAIQDNIKELLAGK